MTDDEQDKPPFSFSHILTQPLVQGLPGSKERIARRSSFAKRLIRKVLRRPTDGAASPTATIASAAKMWSTASVAYKARRLDSLIRCISGLRRPIDAHIKPDTDDRQDVDILTRRAWADVRRELSGRIEKIEDGLERCDPERTPDSYYWMTVLQTPDERVWDDESTVRLAEEIRAVYRALVAARAQIKFLALHVDDLRWLADFGAPATESLTAVPTNRTLKKWLKTADGLKASLNDRVGRILATPVGKSLRGEFDLS